jgi:hypothetical protein
MYLGFTGKKTGFLAKVIAILEGFSKGFYLALDVVATALLGISAAWTTSKGLEQYEIYFEFTFAALIEVFKTPITYVFISLMIYILSKGYQWLDNQKLLNDNKELGISNYEQENRLRTASEDIDEFRAKIQFLYKELIRTWLRSSLKALNLFEPCCRVTLYYFKKNYFYYVGRYSVNPENSKENTLRFELNGGVISQAWRKQIHKDVICPEYDENNPEPYFSYVGETYSFTREKVESLGMKSCQYYARRIDDTSEPIGVIVFESSLKNKFTERQIKRIESYCAEHESNLVSYIRYIRENDHASSTSIKDEGIAEMEFLKDFKGRGDAKN